MEDNFSKQEVMQVKLHPLARCSAPAVGPSTSRATDRSKSKAWALGTPAIGHCTFPLCEAQYVACFLSLNLCSILLGGRICLLI